MIFITLYKLKKKEEEKCSYIVFKKGVLLLGLAEFFISQLPVSSFFFFFLHNEVLLLALGADARVLWGHA